MTTFDDRVEALFKSRPNVWIEYRELAQIGGFSGWRTRVSEVRRQRGMRIDNRWEHVKRADGSGYRVSWYRFVPAE